MVEEIHAEFVNGAGEQFQIEDNSLIIPTNIDRFGLSKMINDLLIFDEPVAFDILFKEEPLRCTISEKLEQYNIKSETTIKLVYILAITEPLETEIDSLNEWISDISYNNKILSTCCYDGHISIYKVDDMVKSINFFNQSKSASSIHMYNRNFGSHFELICASITGLIEVYKVDISEEHPEYSLVAASGKEYDTITSLTTDKNGYVLLAGGYNNTISVYENPKLLTNTGDNQSIHKTGKRVLNEVYTLPLLHNLESHRQPITGLDFLPLQENIFVSSSQDGTLLIWDLNGKSCLSQYNTGKPISCFSISPHGPQISTGHNEGGITILDIRCKDTVDFYTEASNFVDPKVSSVCSSNIHNKLVGSISWNPVKRNIIASFGLDGCAFLIDIRSPKFPLQMTQFELDSEHDRGTRCSWINADNLVCTTASVNNLTLFDLQ
ncbi:WD domain, G-beta repeat domain-containing protein [Theileria equi strain WA]|uniref:WD domain, G-beta repeat domain-containing protein n=1 Tax=Theileria equi strain WA TaxID=1537102 RepID=L0B3F5_THEEQ|nr:WD domain, G-beta repeat domain-containing protein [Theileria equi strain WA]AFZ81654.1 WD domain, G-beta repeat domain-containing protein [Theileria equi strain WA]|eukprot:XP_004831320.1 WD domain, G-beta repeat domain-containing protein [Theileria equi strain WA]